MRSRGSVCAVFDAYVRDIQRYPLLGDDEQRLTRLYTKTRDPKIAREIVVANLRLVVKIAYSYRFATEQLFDLVQEGNIGLVKAVERFDPERGISLSSYAGWWIRSYMLKFLLDNFRLVRIVTTRAQRKVFYNLRKAQEQLKTQGVDATDEMLAELLAVPERDVSTMQIRLNSTETSLDAPRISDGSVRKHRIDAFTSDEEPPDAQAEQRQLLALLRTKLDCFEKDLPEREREILRDRVLAEDAKTLEEIGNHHSVSRQALRKSQVRLLDRLKSYLLSELGDQDLPARPSWKSQLKQAAPRKRAP